MHLQRHISQVGEMVADTVCQTTYANNGDNFELLFVLEGAAQCMVKRRDLKIYPSYFGALNACGAFQVSINDVNPTQYLHLSLQSGFVADATQTLFGTAEAQLEGQTARLEELMGLFQLNAYIAGSLIRISQGINDKSCSDFQMTERLAQCLAHFSLLYRRQQKEISSHLNFVKASTRIELLRRLALAKDFMVSNYAKAISIEEVAGNACLSVNHLLRTFKEAYHLSPYQFLTETRLDAACTLLKTGYYPVNDVVLRVGFECPSSFIRLFRSKYQITPLQYKKQFVN